jgi:hypothetical protein
MPHNEGKSPYNPGTNTSEEMRNYLEKEAEQYKVRSKGISVPNVMIL